MNSYAITVDILHIADMDVQMKPAITAQSAPVYIARHKHKKLEINSVPQTQCYIDVESYLYKSSGFRSTRFFVL